jgi:hypothetical protein
LPTALSVKIVDILIIVVSIIGFGILGAMAVTGIRAATSIGSVTVNTSFSGSSETISVPISLKNPGPLSLNGINVGLVVLDRNGTSLFTGGGGPLSLSPGNSGNLPINVSFDLSQLPQAELASLATTSQNLTLRATIAASVSSITSFAGTFNTVYNWGAPISNLSTGTLSSNAYNQTFAKFDAPLSFEDQSKGFGVAGTVFGTILGESGNTLGSINQLTLNLSPGSSYSGQLSGFISSAALNQRVTFQLSFSTSFGTFTEEITENA